MSTLQFFNLLIVVVFFTGCISAQKNIINKNKSKSYSYNIGTKQKKMYSKNIDMNSTKVIIKDKKSIFKKKQPETKKTIAIVVSSSTIGKYALEAINSINTFMLYKNEPFDIKIYDTQTEKKKQIVKIFDQIKLDNISKAVVILTKQSLYNLNNVEDIGDMKLFLPLINKNDITNDSLYDNLNAVFGAISYKAQFEKLIQYAGELPLVDLYDNSEIGYILHNYLKNNKIKYSKKITDRNWTYKGFLKNNSRVQNSAILLNTPIVKSSMLLSAITGIENLTIPLVLSTQLNYTPLFFKLTQKQDRKRLVVASSIGELPEGLESYNILVGNNIMFSWVNYASIVGVEYLVSDDLTLFKDLSIKDGQVIYPVRLYGVGANSFKLISK